MKRFVSEAAFWVAVALAGVAGVAVLKLIAAGPLGDQWPGLRTFALAL